MTAEALARWEKRALRWGKLAVALAAIGAVLTFGGAVVRGWVIKEARAQAIVNKRQSEAIEQVLDEVRESRKDTAESRKDVRAFYATMRQFTGIRSDRLDTPLPVPVVDGGQ